MKKLILIILLCGSITAIAENIEVKQLNEFTHKLEVKDQWK